MRQTSARIHNILAWALFVGANVAFFLIGLAVFGVARTEVHAWGGRTLQALAILLVIAALLSRTSRLTVVLSVVVFLQLMPLQAILAYSHFPTRMLNALHAANGIAILWVSYALAFGRARARVPVAEPKVVPSSVAPASSPREA
jgi:hypothetical protein